MPGVAPPMVRWESYSEENGSMEKDIIMRASHTHPYFKEEKSKFYYYIEMATRTTSYAASINLYQKKKTGRDSYIALVSQSVRYNKW